MMAFRTACCAFLLGSPLALPGQVLGPPPAAPAMVGGLQVIVNVPGAKVFLDGQPKGELTPPQVLNLADLPVGSVQVRVEAAGYQTRALSFTIQPGAWTQAVFVLVKQGGALGTLPPKTAPVPLPAKAAAAATNAQGLPEATLKAGAVELTMVQVPPGRFRMGSAAGDPSELPVHEVVFAKPFWIGKYPVTQRQWQAVMGYNPSRFKAVGPEAPVESVSWNGCEAFLKSLNEKQSEWTFRLPSEAEWEYACRAGTTGSHFGEALESMAWFRENSGGSTQPVGRKQPNAWGLHDMLGNVWQWCEDRGHDSYEGAPGDGSPWIELAYGAQRPVGRGMKGDSKVMNVRRGGSWDSDASLLRPSQRATAAGSEASKDLGFRLVCTPR